MNEIYYEYIYKIHFNCFWSVLETTIKIQTFQPQKPNVVSFQTSETLSNRFRKPQEKTESGSNDKVHGKKKVKSYFNCFLDLPGTMRRSWTTCMLELI